MCYFKSSRAWILLVFTFCNEAIGHPLVWTQLSKFKEFSVQILLSKYLKKINPFGLPLLKIMIKEDASQAVWLGLHLFSFHPDQVNELSENI